MNVKIIKIIMSEKKTPISQKTKLENIQNRNWKNKHILTHISTNKITESNKLINAGTKLVCDEKKK